MKVGKDSPHERHGNTLYLVVLSLVAVLLILVSVVLDYWTFWHHIGESAEERIRSSEPFFRNTHIYSAFTRELGFAFIIALIVTVALERRAKKEQASYFSAKINELSVAHDRNRREISKDILTTVLGSRIPEAISSLTLQILMEQRIIRKNLYLKYNLTPIQGVDTEISDRYIKVEVTIKYRLENITETDDTVDIKLCLPFPADPQLAELVKVEEMTLGERRLSDDEIVAGNARLEDTPTEMRAAWPLSIAAGKSEAVSARFIMIKEKSDNDCWTSLYPTTDGQYEVVMGVPGLEWSVDALHSGSLQPADGSEHVLRVGGTCVYNLEKGLLPFQGLLVWWRPNIPRQTQLL